MGRFESIGEHACDPYKGFYCAFVAVVVIVVSSVSIANSAAEINVWVNQGLCETPGAQVAVYSSALWTKLADYHGFASSCAANPAVGQVITNRIPLNLFTEKLPYMPRLYYTDGIDLRSINITLRDGSETLGSWTNAPGQKQRRRLTGRKLLKGGSSGGSSGGSYGHSRSNSGRSIRTSPSYRRTGTGGRMGSAVASDDGVTVTMISRTKLSNERLLESASSGYDVNGKVLLSKYKNQYKQMPSCVTGCQVDLFDSFTMEDFFADQIDPDTNEPVDNGNAVGQKPLIIDLSKRSSTLELDVTVHVKFDALAAATKGTVSQPGEPAVYNTGFPKVFVTFALTDGNPMLGLWITILVFAILGLICVAPLLMTERYEECCEHSCHKLDCDSDDEDDIKTGEMVSVSPNHYRAPKQGWNMVREMAPTHVATATVVGLTMNTVELNRPNNDYRTTDIAGSRKGSVTKIVLSNNDVNKIRGLEKMPLLAELILDSNDLGRLFGLHNSRSLRVLSVNDNNLVNLDGCESQSLISLCAKGNNLKTLSGINCPRLQDIDVSGNEIRDASGLNGFATPTLFSANLSNNDLTSLGNLSSCMCLERLDASHNDINDDNSLLALIQNCKQLKYLNITDNDIKKSTLARIKDMAGPGVQIICD